MATSCLRNYVEIFHGNFQPHPYYVLSNVRNSNKLDFMIVSTAHFACSHWRKIPSFTPGFYEERFSLSTILVLFCLMLPYLWEDGVTFSDGGIWERVENAWHISAISTMGLSCQSWTLLCQGTVWVLCHWLISLVDSRIPLDVHLALELSCILQHGTY